MNYRHHFHAGNFADVVKHALLVQLVRSLQKKEKGFLYLDTHAGRGSYDLAESARGDTLARKPEWPEGIGRLWSESPAEAALAEYVSLVKRFDRERGGSGETPRFYPGSPWLARLLARTQDRLVLCERQPEEQQSLAREFSFSPNTTVPGMDGYVAVKAFLPPPERRALVLIDPPFEAPDEFAQIVESLREGLARLLAGVFAIWYPLTERARIDAFFAEMLTLKLPPTAAFELFVAGTQSTLKMRGCGLVVINPPWQFETLAEPMMKRLCAFLEQDHGASSRLEWLVREKS